MEQIIFTARSELPRITFIMSRRRVLLDNGNYGWIVEDNHDAIPSMSNPNPNPNSQQNNNHNPNSPYSGQFIYVSHQSQYRSPQASYDHQQSGYMEIPNNQNFQPNNQFPSNPMNFRTIPNRQENSFMPPFSQNNQMANPSSFVPANLNQSRFNEPARPQISNVPAGFKEPARPQISNVPADKNTTLKSSPEDNEEEKSIEPYNGDIEKLPKFKDVRSYTRRVLFDAQRNYGFENARSKY